MNLLSSSCTRNGFNNVRRGSCYECVAKTCSSYGYQSSNSCTDGKLAVKHENVLLGDETGTCWECKDATDEVCSTAHGNGYQKSACAQYYKADDVQSDGCHTCVPQTCAEIGDSTYQLASCESEPCANGQGTRDCHSQTFGSTTCYYKDNEATCDSGDGEDENLDSEALQCPPAGTRVRVEYVVEAGLNNNYKLAAVNDEIPSDFAIVSAKGFYNYEINYKGQKVYETGNGGNKAHGLRFTGERNGELCATETDACLADFKRSTGKMTSISADIFGYTIDDLNLKQSKENAGYLCDTCTDGVHTSYNCHCLEDEGGELSDGQCLHEIPVNSVVRNLDNLCTILGVSQNNEERGCKKYSCWDLDKDNGVFSAQVQYKVRNNSAWQSLPEKSYRLNSPTGTTNFEGAKIHIHSGKVQVSYTNAVSITGDSLGGGIDFGQNNNNGGWTGTLQPGMNSVSRISVYALDQKSADGGLQSDEETIENLLSASKTNNICPVAHDLTIAKGSVSVTLNTNDLIRAYTPVTSDGVTTQRYGVWGHTLTYYSFVPK